MSDSILVVAPHLGTLTDCSKTLDALTARRWRVHIVVCHEPPPGVDLSVFTGKFRRLTVGHAPAPDMWALFGTTVRGVLDCWRYLDADSAAEEAYRRMLREAPPLAARIASSGLLTSSAIRGSLTWLLRRLERSMPSSPAIVEFLRTHKPTLVIALPLFGAGTIASCYMQAAAELRIPTFGFPLRWDDPMQGALLHRLPDCVAFWNRDQRQYMVEGLGVPARRTLVLGASLRLDPASPSRTSREAFCQRRGLDAAQRIVLCVPRPAQDLAMLTRWVESVRSSPHPLVRDANLLVYFAPPGGVEQTSRAPIPDSLVVPQPGLEPAQYDSDTVDALTHADVVVAWDTTLLFEAAARGRPTVALRWPDGGDRDLARVCAASVERRGWPLTADSLDEHDTVVAGLLAAGLDGDRQAAARTWVRPHGSALAPGFLMSVRVFKEVLYRGADTPAAAPAPAWTRRLLWPLARLAARPSALRPADRGVLAHVVIGVASAKALFLHQPLLRALAERGHRLSIVLTPRSGLPLEAYDRVRCDVPGVDIRPPLIPRDDLLAAWSRTLAGIASLGGMTRFRQDGQVTPSWLAAYATAVLPASIGRVGSVMVRLPWASAWFRRTARALIRWLPAPQAASDVLRERQPDVVVVIPDDDAVLAFESAATQRDLVRAATSLRIPVVAGAGATELGTHSAITSSSVDVMWVWNDQQRQMAVADGVADQRLVVTGALPLDRCLSDAALVTRDEFHAMLGLPGDQPFVLFAGSNGLMSEPGAETELVQDWVRALRANTDPRLRRLVVLIRPSTVGTSRWRALDFPGDRHVVICPDTYERSGELDAVLLAESVKYAAVTVGADPLSLFMAAALDRPGVAIVPPGVSKGSAALPFDYLWKTEGSRVRLAATLEELTHEVCSALEGDPKPASQRFLRSHVRPQTDTIPSVAAADSVERAALRSPWRVRDSQVR